MFLACNYSRNYYAQHNNDSSLLPARKARAGRGLRREMVEAVDEREVIS